MRNFQDTFETRKQSFVSAFSICMTVSLRSIIRISARWRDIKIDLFKFQKQFHC